MPMNPFIAQLMQYIQRMPNQGNYRSFFGGQGAMRQSPQMDFQRSGFMQGPPTAPATLDNPAPPTLQSQPGIVPTPTQPVAPVVPPPVLGRPTAPPGQGFFAGNRPSSTMGFGSKNFPGVY